ncbi:CDP-glycerol glycerophosphotransferase family protein [Streptomyces spectabilis]|uniref:CDP-glycerol glycerophosphotransferase n=1 Tax=Streptomyces spectabilis TaxID=68270 RepID=A0A7W8AXN0_STRST|nr:CDP-glycerol glycerophosphotransferase family protein [Streptomyces spectabilis]MBB5106488.1 CDP-glycerol glycerophosphotransferase [Streptomyces spectabilis]MCI3903097.1 CDP-glycerol glycerophosphotransferase family protein [Streptomyces spectabilis]GGV54509.1 transferase [Streptomyces spectabilis]
MRPQLSVVVHGRNVQGHLGESLDALARQAGADVEVVVAAVGTSARAAAARHPGLTLVALPEETPDGAARAAGAARAGGRWLHFVPSKDSVPTGAARAVAERAAALPDTVDVLLTDHTRSTWRHTRRPSPDGRFLAEPGRREVSLADCPDLLKVTPVLGNRVLRRDFWRDRQDLLATDDELFAAYAALLTADRIAVFDQAALEERRLRPESLPPPTAEDHFALLETYERLLRLAEQRAAGPGPFGVLYVAMVTAGLRTVARAGLPEPQAREFFHRAALAAVAFRPPGHRRPGGLEGVRRRLLEEDAYTKYRAFQLADQRRRKLRSAVAGGRRRAAKTVRDIQYHQDLRRPLDPRLAVFSAYWDRGVACNPGAIAAKLAELAPHIHPVWVVSRANEPLLPPGTDHVVPGTRRYWRVMATAKYLVNNANFPNAIVKRQGSVHLQTHHGTPLKRMGLDQLDYPAAAQGLNFHELLARVDRWDYSVSSNSHSTQMWQRAYQSRYTELDHGYPRNDVYYTATAADVRAVRDRLGIAPGKRALLYAPTHRDYEATWTPRLDLAALASRLGEDTVLLVRGHYFYGGAGSSPAAPRRTGRIVDVSAYDPVEDLALAADALVTDYSSLMFDYANLDRPIVVYADDWETYAKTRGVYFDLLAEPPGAVARTQEELTEILTTDAWRDAAARRARAAFRRRFCEFDDGRAAERVVRRVFLDEPESALPPVVPLDERVPAPTPEEAVL